MHVSEVAARLGAALPGVDPAAVRLSGPRRFWGTALDVEGLALGSVTLAAAALQRLIGAPRLSVAAERVAASFDSARLLRVDGNGVPSFAPLSRFWPVADGWIRTHGNYPHHRAALLRALEIGDVGDEAAVPAVASALRTLTAAEAEHLILTAGGIAAAVRPRREWVASAAGIAAAGQEPLVVTHDDAATGSARRAAPRWTPQGERSPHPLAGLRVVELTRVIAGPTATRTLAALGADVVRVEPPHVPELRSQHLDTDAGKRVLGIDLRSDAERVHALLADARVVVTGFRPGSLARYGLEGEALASRHPHLVRASLSAWGPGPWAGRRGFDSIVQAASGISVQLRGEDGTPGALPVQALDHATGQLLVAGIASLLSRRAEGGAEGGAEAGAAGSVAASLTATAEALWALTLPSEPVQPLAPAGTQPWGPGEWEGPESRLDAAPAALAVDGVPARPASWWGPEPWR